MITAIAFQESCYDALWKYKRSEIDIYGPQIVQVALQLCTEDAKF